MSDQKLIELVEELKSEIDGLPDDASEARDRLGKLVQDLERGVGESGEGGFDESMVEDLRDSIRHLEVSHPRATGLLNHIMVVLGNMGI